MASPETRTPEGWELQFATNHLGHFALATGLRGALASAGGARVVSVSSSAHLRSPVVFEDIHFRERAVRPVVGVRAVQDRQRPVRGRGDPALGGRRHHRQRADAGRYPDQPAAVSSATRTSNASAPPPAEAPRTGRRPQQGAATSVLVATSPLLDGVGGRYFEDCTEAELNQPGHPPRRRRVRPRPRGRHPPVEGDGGHPGRLKAGAVRTGPATPYRRRGAWRVRAR